MNQTFECQLEEVIRKSLLDFHKDVVTNDTCIKIVRVLPRPFSTITFIDVNTPDTCHQYVAKQTKYDPRNARLLKQANQSLVEYQQLEKLYPRLEEEKGIAVPKPILVLPEWDTYIMEFVEGNTLADLEIASRIGYKRDKFRALVLYYNLLGQWTAKFHEINGIYHAPLDEEEFFFTRTKELFEMANKTCQRSLIQKVQSRLLKKIDGYLSRLQGCHVPYTIVHSDFGPWNIMANKKRITVFDFMGSQKGPWPRDVMDIDIHLEHISYNLCASRSRARHMRDAFWSGYGPRPECPQEWTDLCKTIIYLEEWCSSYIPKQLNFAQKLSRFRWRRRCQDFLLHN